MKFSILIPTLPERHALLKRLENVLLPQLVEGVEIVKDDRPRGISTGQKRTELISRANGQHVCFVDDDDMVAVYYVSEILKALESNPDCVTFDGWMTTNGISRVDWSIKLGERYEARKDPDGITRYYRFPNHLCPIRKTIAQQVIFPAKYQGEDYEWAKSINDRGLLKTSVHIPLKLYHYDYRTVK